MQPIKERSDSIHDIGNLYSNKTNKIGIEAITFWVEEKKTGMNSLKRIKDKELLFCNLWQNLSGKTEISMANNFILKNVISHLDMLMHQTWNPFLEYIQHNWKKYHDSCFILCDNKNVKMMCLLWWCMKHMICYFIHLPKWIKQGSYITAFKATVFCNYWQRLVSLILTLSQII